MVLQPLARNRHWYLFINSSLSSFTPFLNLGWQPYVEARKKTTLDFRASPILASSHANLAPASIHIAGVDTLTSEGIAYHEILKKAGTKSTLKVYEGCGHPFAHWDGELEKAREFVRDSLGALRSAYTVWFDDFEGISGGHPYRFSWSEEIKWPKSLKELLC
jgi:acetyl esterase/lipase